MTEGWPASVRLLAISLEQAPHGADPPAFLAQLAQADRHVFDFLAGEVLDRQSPAVRAFLLQTSILAELTPHLCRAVTGRADAGDILHDLNRRSLFLSEAAPGAVSTISDVADDRQRIAPRVLQDTQHAARSTPRAYRYHPLFVEFLRGRLEEEQPDQVADLHRRAAAAQSDPARAIHHYLAAQDWETAAQRIEQIGPLLFGRGNTATVQAWINALPRPTLDAHPCLDLLGGECALQRGDWRAAQTSLARAAQKPGDQAGEALATLAACALLQSDLASAAALIGQALTQPVSAPIRSQLLMGRAWSHIYRRAWQEAQADVAAALDLALEMAVGERGGSADESAAPFAVNSPYLALALYLKSELLVLPGILARAELFCRRAEAADGGGLLQLAVGELDAFLHLWRGRLDEAVRTTHRALALKDRFGGYPFQGLDALACLGLVHSARGSYDQAEACLQELLHRGQWGGQAAIDTALVLFWLGRCHWLQGRLDDAAGFYARLCAAETLPELPALPMLRLTLGGLLEMSGRRYTAAGQSLWQAAELAGQMPIARVYACPRLALARFHLEQGWPQAALAELASLLAECERDDTPGLILQEGALVVPLLRLAQTQRVQPAFVSRLLVMLGTGALPGPVYVAQTGETLTPREVEVLRLLAEGCSNRELADRLAVSSATIKSHLAHIFAKLDVSSRRQAAQRGRDLHL